MTQPARARAAASRPEARQKTTSPSSGVNAGIHRPGDPCARDARDDAAAALVSAASVQTQASVVL